MGPKKAASKAASNRLVVSGQQHTGRGFGAVKKQIEVDIVELLESSSDEEDDLSEYDADDDTRQWTILEPSSDEEEEKNDVSDGEVESIDVDEVVKSVRNLFVEEVEFVPFGQSARSKRRRKNKADGITASVVNYNKIDKYFVQPEISTDVEENLDAFDDRRDQRQNSTDRANEMDLIQRALNKLDEDGFAEISRDKRTEKKNSEVSKFEYLQYLAIDSFFNHRLRGFSKVESSRRAANSVFKKWTEFSYKMVCIRRWAKYYLEHQELKPYNASKLSRTKTIITNEEVQVILKEHIRSIEPRINRTPVQFMHDLNDEILRTIPGAPIKVSESTARRWMRFLGFTLHRHKKNYYVDGHEREDVVLDRNNRFLPAMDAYERRMAGWEGRNMETIVLPALLPAEMRVVVIVHDESIVYSNDASKLVWVENGIIDELRPKSNGRSQHISGFCCSCHGFIECELTGMHTFKIITPGKNNDGYWKNSDLVAQFAIVAPIFERTHPGCKLVFVFDNSQNHHARAPGGLCASTMNKGPGGKNKEAQRDTVYNGVPQQLWQQKKSALGNPMWDDEAHTVPTKEPKGVYRILLERGVQCSHMSVKAMREHLALHHDFAEELGWLERVVTERGHEILYLPKFHCELNYIEMVWAYVKSYLRRNCVFSFGRLKQELPGVLMSIPVACFRRFERHCLRFMSGYRQHNLQGPILDYIMKKFKSHRRIPVLLTTDVDAYKEEMMEKMKKKLSGGMHKKSK